MISIAHSLQVLIALQCALFLLFLALEGLRGRPSNQILAIWLGVLGAHMVNNLLPVFVPSLDAPNVAYWFGLGYGPLMYIYIRSLTTHSFSLRLRYGLHLLPAGVMTASLAFFIPPYPLGPLLVFASIGGYLVLAGLEISRFRAVLLHTRSDSPRIGLRWATQLLIMMAVVLALNIASVVLYRDRHLDIWYVWSQVALYLALLANVNAFWFKGLRYPQLFQGISAEDRLIADTASQAMALAKDINTPTESSNSTPSGADVDVALMFRLQEHLKQSKPYLDPMLSLQTLSRQLGESPRRVSTVINRGWQLNFSDFVNHYRLEEVKACLAEAANNRPILDIVFDAGFSTKSNFNRVFKKMVGMTPSAYRELAIQQQRSAQARPIFGSTSPIFSDADVQNHK